MIWLQGTSSQPRKGGLAGSSGVRRRRQRREPVGSQVHQLEIDIWLILGELVAGGILLKFKGGVAEPVPWDSGSWRETDTVTDPALGIAWIVSWLRLLNREPDQGFGSGRILIWYRFLGIKVNICDC